MSDSPLTLDELREQWNAILDNLLKENRIAWLAYFDARLVSLNDGILSISFIDAEKFQYGHQYQSARTPSMQKQLEAAIKEVIGYEIKVEEK
jgi:hypothetical protein